ncbi:hypothetical protein DIPPA_18011 [Diplonema papillatum]|nr:hypothetical protein DIPPA_18011 [Diplonema papillatum]
MPSTLLLVVSTYAALSAPAVPVGIALGTAKACAAEQFEPLGPWYPRDCSDNTVSIQFARMWNATHGFAYSTDAAAPAAGVALRRTVDSGAHWAVVHQLGPFEAYTDIDWMNWDVAIAAGWNKVNGTTTAVLLRTQDGGLTWAPSTIYTEASPQVAIHAGAVAWYSGYKALAGGYIYEHGSPVGKACTFHTTDAGLTWAFAVHAEARLIDHIHPVTDVSLWIGGIADDNKAAIWRTMDEGQSFIREVVKGDDAFVGSSAYQVNMKNNGTGPIAGRAVVGNHDAVLVYDPATQVWTPELATFYPDEQISMVYNNKLGTAAVAAGRTSTLGVPFIAGKDSPSDTWKKHFVLGNVSTAEAYHTIYLFY